MVSKQTKALQHAGPEGEAVLHDIDIFIPGINDYLATTVLAAPLTRNDVFALNALKDQFVGRAAATRLAAPSSSVGSSSGSAPRGYSVFNDLRQFTQPGQPDHGRRHLQLRARIPTKPGAPGSVVLDPNSFTPTPVRAGRASPKYGRAEPAQAATS